MAEQIQNIRDKLMRRSFDVFQRFGAMVEIAGKLRASGMETLLDVGGYPGELGDILAEACPGLRIATLDRPVARRAGYVCGSAEALPFADASFDAIVSSDMLEHLPLAIRTPALKEMRRASRRWIVIGAPFKSPAVECAESAVNGLAQKCFGKPNQWLAEHIGHGLPEIDATRGILAEGGAAVCILPNGSVLSWFIMEAAKILLETFPMLSPLAPALNLRFNGLWAAGDDHEPAYRHFLIADKSGKMPVGFQMEAEPAPENEEAVLKKLQALNELARGMAEKILGVLTNPKEASPLLTARYIKQMEEIIGFQEKEQTRLREAVERQEMYLKNIQKNFFFRLLRKAKLL